MSNEEPTTDLPAGIGNPARRALADAGITQLKQLTKISETDLLKLHGIGPKAVRILKEALVQRDLNLMRSGSTQQTPSAKPKTINDYLATVGEDKRAALEKLRQIIKSIVPAAEECISYQLPAFCLDGKPLVAFGATTKHCAFYLMSATTVEAHKDLLTQYDTSKGTIRFTVDKPLPVTLVRKLVKARIAENLGKK